MLGIGHDKVYQTLVLDYVGVKSPQFSYNRLKGADPVAGVEMASTGEVACFGSNVAEAFYASWLATDQRIKDKSLFLSLPDEQKHKSLDEAAALVAAGWRVYTTSGTHRFLKQNGIATTRVHKIQDKAQPNIRHLIDQQKVALMVSVPSPGEATDNPYKLRRLAIDNHIPLLTNAETGRLLLRCLTDKNLQNPEPKSWQEYLRPST